jgi:hypothetical protein
MTSPTPPSAKDKLYWAGIYAIIVVMGLLLTPETCGGQMVRAGNRVDTVYVMPAGYLGLTQCGADGQAESWIKVGLEPLHAAEVDAHEAMHRAQAARYPTCEAYQAAYRASLRTQIETEAEAYCAGFAVRVAAGQFDWDRAAALILRHLSNLYMGVPLEAMAATVVRWCHG